MAVSALITSVVKIATDVLDRVIPDNASEQERHQYKMELEEQLFNHDWSRFEAELQDRAGARQLAANELLDAPPWTKALAAVNRPIWSLMTLAGFTWSWVMELTIPPPIENVVLTVVYFYFGGRTIEKVATIVRKHI